MADDDKATENANVIALATRAMSSVTKRLDLANRFGQMFKGKRDFYKELGYVSSVSYENTKQRYARQGVVSRIVNAYPDAIWTRPPAFIGNEDLDKAINGYFDLGDLNDENAKSEVTDGLAQTIGLYHYINRVERLAGLGKYAILVLGFDDVKDTRNLKDPVGKKPGPKPKGGKSTQLLYVQAYGYDAVEISKYTDNAADPNFGLPEIYSVKVKSAGDPSNTQTIEIHHERVLHVAESQLDDEVEGYPIIERVYNELDDLMKVSGGGAEAAWQGFYKGLQFDLDKDVSFTETDRDKMVEEIERYSHGQQRHIRTRGININELGADQIDPGPAFNVVVSLISTATGIPQRIFIGSEQGKLASEQDRSNWSGRIEERRELHSEPKVLRPLITKLQNAGVVPSGAYELDWPDPFRLSPLERGQTSAQQARSAVNIARTVLDLPDLLVPAEARAIIFARGALKPRMSAQERQRGNKFKLPKPDPVEVDDGDDKDEKEPTSKDDTKSKDPVDDKKKSE